MQYILRFHDNNGYANAYPCTLYVHCLPCYVRLVTTVIYHRLVQEIFRRSIDLLLCKSIGRLWSGCHELLESHPQLRPQCVVWMLFRFTSRLFLGNWTMPRYPIYFIRRWTNHVLQLSSRSAIHYLSPSILHYFPLPIQHYQELPVALQDHFVFVRQYSSAHGFWPVEFSSGRQGASR